MLRCSGGRNLLSSGDLRHGLLEQLERLVALECGAVGVSWGTLNVDERGYCRGVALVELHARGYSACITLGLRVGSGIGLRASIGRGCLRNRS